MSVTDQQLLQDYAECRSEAAFAELVRRHIDLVYSVAVRMVCDSHLARDVTQRVFVILARKAGGLTERPVLAGWLHHTARHIAAETVRTDVRRRTREKEAAILNSLLASEPETLWTEIAPHLDAALGELSQADRDAVLERYFERKSARETAQRWGVSEDAAQKRVSRAIERLRELFAKRGISVGTSALVALIAANAVGAAPAGLAAAIANSALASAAATATTFTLLKLVTMTKMQAATIGVIAAGLVVSPFVLKYGAKLRDENRSLREQMVRVEAENLALRENLRIAKQEKSPDAGSIASHASPHNAAFGSQSNQPSPYERVTDFLKSHREVPREKIEAYLQKNHRNLESLMAAFQISHDLDYLREAATNSPNDPAVQFAVIANHVFPGEERKWIDAFKASSTQNALPWYFSALDYFKSKQSDQAIQELGRATRRPLYGDYAAQTCQAVEEMYEAAGWPSLAAKAVAPGTVTTSSPYIGLLKALGNEAVQSQRLYLSQGDTESANSLASMGMILANQLRRAGGPIDELVGVAIETKILAQLDPAVSYAFLDRPVIELQSDLNQQKETIRQALMTRDQVRPNLEESELYNYWEREKLYGEIYALQWLQSKHRQP